MVQYLHTGTESNKTVVADCGTTCPTMNKLFELYVNIFVV